MRNFALYTFGEKIHIKAHHFVVSDDEQRIHFYASETSVDDTWTVFLRGVSAIHDEGEAQDFRQTPGRQF